MKLEAVIMTRTVVPFNYNASSLDVDSHLEENEEGKMVVADREKLESEMADIEKSRLAAAEHANTVLVEALKKAIGKKGEIIEVVVEEVREQ
jgi:hypothetical protein